LFSPVSLNTNNFIDDTHLSLYPHSHDGSVSSSSLALHNRGLDSEYALLPHPADCKIQEFTPNHQHPFILDPSQKLCSQGPLSRSESSSNSNSDFTCVLCAIFPEGIFCLHFHVCLQLAGTPHSLVFADDLCRLDDSLFVPSDMQVTRMDSFVYQ
jgi:hypothetical protein